MNERLAASASRRWLGIAAAVAAIAIPVALIAATLGRLAPTPRGRPNATQEQRTSESTLGEQQATPERGRAEWRARRDDGQSRGIRATRARGGQVATPLRATPRP